MRQPMLELRPGQQENQQRRDAGEGYELALTILQIFAAHLLRLPAQAG